MKFNNKNTIIASRTYFQQRLLITIGGTKEAAVSSKKRRKRFPPPAVDYRRPKEEMSLLTCLLYFLFDPKLIDLALRRLKKALTTSLLKGKSEGGEMVAGDFDGQRKVCLAKCRACLKKA